MENSTIKPWLTIKEAQKASGFSMYSLRCWVRDGKIPTRFSGNTAYIFAAALLDPSYPMDGSTVWGTNKA